jgi:hypothetical protein
MKIAFFLSPRIASARSVADHDHAHVILSAVERRRVHVDSANTETKTEAARRASSDSANTETEAVTDTTSYLLFRASDLDLLLRHFCRRMLLGLS